MKKILCCFLAILIVFSLSVPAFANEGTDISESTVSMSETNIVYDFEHVFLKEFNVGMFPENKNKAQPELITVAETGYKQGDKTNYKLFLYFYNPSRIEIAKDSDLNLIEVSSKLFSSEISNGYPYLKQKLKLVDYYGNSTSSLTHTNALILKYEIADYTSFNNFGYAETVERFYIFSSVEFLVGDNANATDYPLGNDYDFCTVNGWTSYTTETVDVIRINNLEFSYYRVPTEHPDVFKDIQSVAVPIPNSYLNKYKDISGVHAVWEECLTKPILVADDTEIVNAFRGVLNTDNYSEFDYALGYGSDTEDENYKYKFEHQFNLLNPLGSTSVRYQTLGYLFNSNIDINGNKTHATSYVWNEDPCYCNLIDKVYFAYHSDDVFDSDTLCVSSSELEAKLDEYEWSDDVFESIDTTHYDLNNPEFLDANYINKQDVYRVANLWEQFFKWASMIDSEEDVVYSSIKKVDVDDLKVANMSRSEFKKKYLISEDEDYTNIQKLYLNNPNCTIFMFYFTVTDYITNRAYIYTEDSDEPVCDAIVAQSTAIRNFDFIDLAFGEGKTLTVVPVSSNPSNAVPGVTGNDSYNPPYPVAPSRWNDFIEFMQVVLSILVVIMILILALRIYSAFKRPKVVIRKERKK